LETQSASIAIILRSHIVKKALTHGASH